MEPINLFKEPKRFGELPKTARRGILTLFAGWIVHFTFIYSVLRDLVTDNMLLQQAGVAVITCFVLLKLKNWARILCITGNAMVLLNYLIYLVPVSRSQGPAATGLILVNLALFGASTYFLLTPASAAFFKQQSVKPPPPAD